LSRKKEIVVAAEFDREFRTRFAASFEQIASLNSGKRFVSVFELAGKHSAGKGRDVFKSFSNLISALVRGEIDLAEADGTDLPTNLPHGVEIFAVLDRSNPFDVFISSDDMILDEQPEEARVAVTNQVEMGQLLYYRPDLDVVVRGDGFDNLCAEMENGVLNGFVYPASKVEAIDKQDKVVEVFTSSICMPVAGQGSIAIIGRKGERELKEIVKGLNDMPSYDELLLEKAFAGTVSKDKKAPIGVLSSIDGRDFKLEGVIVSPDGSERISGSISGKLAESEKLLAELAEELLSSGGEDIINFIE